MKINAGQAPSTLIPEYIGSAFDKIITVANNIEHIAEIANSIKGSTVNGYIGDIPPTEPTAGATWYCTLDGRSYIWYVDTDSGQWVESSPQSDVSTSPDKMTLNAAATDVATTIELVNQIRAGLIAIGLAQ